MTDTRREVMAQIITFMEEAEKRGLDPWKAAEQAFPGIPSDVVAAAWVDLGDRKTEAWWQSIEKTIDGEIITKALEHRATEAAVALHEFYYGEDCDHGRHHPERGAPEGGAE